MVSSITLFIDFATILNVRCASIKDGFIFTYPIPENRSAFIYNVNNVGRSRVGFIFFNSNDFCELIFIVPYFDIQKAENYNSSSHQRISVFPFILCLILEIEYLSIKIEAIDF